MDVATLLGVVRRENKEPTSNTLASSASRVKGSYYHPHLGGSPERPMLKAPSQLSPPPTASPSTSSPSSCPPKKKTQCGDRFVPSRVHRNLADDFEKHAALLAAAALSPTSPTSPPQLSSSPGKESMSPYELVLRSELLGETKPTKSCRRRLFQYKPDGDAVGCATTPATSESPISKRSQELLRTPPKTPRKIATSPFRVLEVPAIRDDFYLNLVHWSSQNILAVGLGNCVYLWNAGTGQVTNLCELAPSDPVTSVNWNARGTHLAVGTNKGVVQQWDVAKRTKIREFGGHVSRIGALSWRDSVVTSGSRDRLIINRDVRERSPHTSKLIGHRQEVCGLQWSPDHQFLASGGNDNRLLIWDVNSTRPLYKYTDHAAAVKAIAWSPHQRGLLASGGGTADRHIRFWNVLNNQPVQAVDTGSQVCNLVWSVSVNELVSTHGYSQNQVAVWSYPTMTQIATLTGHATRVLYLSMSPDGQTIVTGAGDETLRFWNVFPPTRTAATLGDFGSLSFGSMQIR